MRLACYLHFDTCGTSERKSERAGKRERGSPLLRDSPSIFLAFRITQYLCSRCYSRRECYAFSRSIGRRGSTLHLAFTFLITSAVQLLVELTLSLIDSQSYLCFKVLFAIQAFSIYLLIILNKYYLRLLNQSVILNFQFRDQEFL